MIKNNRYISGFLTAITLASNIGSCINMIKEVKALSEEISNSFSWKLLFSSTWFYITLMLTVFLVFLIFFLIRNEKQKKIIERLVEENTRQANRNNVAKLKGHSLTFTHLKYQLSRLYNNHLQLSLMSIVNTVEDNNEERKNTKVTMELIGVCVEPSLCFKFAITGQSIITADALNLKAFDLIEQADLTVSAVDYGSKNDVREFTLSYSRKKKANEPIHLKIQWQWPQALELTDDFITLPNFYSETTSKIRMELRLNKCQTCKIANIYRYSPDLEKPIHLCDVAILPSNNFVFELDNPESDSDYILYYK